jgi:hypothetical protein
MWQSEPSLSPRDLRPLSSKLHQQLLQHQDQRKAKQQQALQAAFNWSHQLLVLRTQSRQHVCISARSHMFDEETLAWIIVV